MKRFLFTACILALCVFAAGGCKKIVTVNELPPVAQTFVSTNFPGTNASYVIKECCEYEVTLSDGTQLEFNRKGEWRKVDMKNMPVPASVAASLPAPAAAYLETSFPGVPVEKVEIEHRRYKVELLNGLELEFNSKGICKEIDD